ncbi:MAG: UV DNA damage repair endonuclease UvsE [Chloroflexota bacterium]
MEGWRSVEGRIVKIGYPSINWHIGCKGNRTFRLSSYSEERLISTVSNNLDCLRQILRFNVNHNILFFRITSDLIPFASHPVCQFAWAGFFAGDFASIGSYIRAHGVRISMHPGQYVVLNTPNAVTLDSTLSDLDYHAAVLDAMGLDASAKIQVHVGGVYGDREASIRRFVGRYERLDGHIKRRLVIENDERSYMLSHCLRIHEETGIPVLFDVFHHELNNLGEPIADAFPLFTATWADPDGLPLVDYSHRSPGKPGPGHADTVDLQHFAGFLQESRPFDFDVMLEIKDKEASALKAVGIAKDDERFIRAAEPLD